LRRALSLLDATRVAQNGPDLLVGQNSRTIDWKWYTPFSRVALNRPRSRMLAEQRKVGDRDMAALEVVST